MRNKCGTVAYPLSQQIKDTAAVHGMAWTAGYYRRAGVPLEQFLMLLKGA